MMITHYETADHLRINDVIIDGRSEIRVTQLDRCSPRGVIKVHVNGDKCFDTLSPLMIKRPTPKENRND